MKISITRLNLLLLVAIIVAVFLMKVYENRLVFKYPRYSQQAVKELETHSIVFPFSTAEGKQFVYYLSVDGAKLPERIWILFSGNSGTALGWLGLRTIFPENAALLLVDYPGFGQSEGTSGAQAIQVVADAGIAAVASHYGVQPAAITERLAVLGESIGTGPALELTRRYGLKRVVLLYPYTSISDMACHIYREPICWLATNVFDNSRELRLVLEKGGAADITIFHGTEDRIIPVEMSRRLKQLGGEKVKYIEAVGADHSIAWLQGVLGERFLAALR